MKSFIFILITSLMLLSAHSDSTSNKVCPVMNDEWADSKFAMEYQCQSIVFNCEDNLLKLAEKPGDFTANLSNSTQLRIPLIIHSIIVVATSHFGKTYNL